MDWTKIKDALVDFLKNGGIRLINFILVFIVGFLLIKLALSIVKKLFNKSKLDSVAVKFIYNTVKFTLWLLLLIALAQVIGIPITGFIAVLSAAGLALSLALQGSLSNLANGVVIICTKPFKEGDYVKINEVEGKIQEIKMMHTIINTTDNKVISVPNKTVVESEIINYNGKSTRRVTFNFNVAYKSDVTEVKNIIYNTIKNTEFVLSEPDPFVAIDSLDSSAIKFYANCWTKTENYWDVYYNVTEQVFNELKRAKIVIPFNQLEVNLKKDTDRELPYIKEDKGFKKLFQSGKKKNNLDEKPKEENDKPEVEVIDELQENVAANYEQPSVTPNEEVEYFNEDDIEDDSNNVVVVGETPNLTEATLEKLEEKKGLFSWLKKEKKVKPEKPAVIIQKKKK